jgi:hypothetical protein
MEDNRGNLGLSVWTSAEAEQFSSVLFFFKCIILSAFQADRRNCGGLPGFFLLLGLLEVVQ